jgi:hypothetical protein
VALPEHEGGRLIIRRGVAVIAETSSIEVAGPHCARTMCFVFPRRTMSADEEYGFAGSHPAIPADLLEEGDELTLEVAEGVLAA